MNDGLEQTNKSLLNTFTNLLLTCNVNYSYKPENVSGMKTDNITFFAEDKKYKITFTIVNGREGFFTIEDGEQRQPKKS